MSKDKYDFYNKENLFRVPYSKRLVDFDTLYEIYLSKSLDHVEKESFRGRLYRGWSVPQAMSMDKHEKRLNFSEIEDSLESIRIGNSIAPFTRFYNSFHCKDRNIDKNTILRRLYCGMDPQDAFTLSFKEEKKDIFFLTIQEIAEIYKIEEDTVVSLILKNRLNKKRPKYVNLETLKKLEKHIKKYIKDKEEKEFYDCLPYKKGINSFSLKGVTITEPFEDTQELLIV